MSKSYGVRFEMNCPECSRQAVILGALRDPDRLAIAKTLRRGQTTFDELCKDLGKSHAEISSYLWYLKNMGIVEITSSDIKQESIYLRDRVAINILAAMNKTES